MTMLELQAASRHFGGIRAVDGLDLAVAEGEIFGLIGPNGSGKSTTVNLVSGLFPLTTGGILFRGADLTGVPVHRGLGLGIARTFQNIRLFGHLTVWQNLWVAQNSPEDHARKGFLRRWLGGSSGARAEIGELLEFAGLAHKQDELAANLAFGEQRRLELARALAARPKLLLLDEPAAGMNAEEIGQLRERILGPSWPRGHDPPRRARHGARDGRDRPDRGAQLRPEDRRRHAVGDPGRSGGAKGLPRRRGEVTAPLLEVGDLVTAYGKIEALKGSASPSRRGRSPACSGRTAPGKQRS